MIVGQLVQEFGKLSERVGRFEGSGSSQRSTVVAKVAATRRCARTGSARRSCSSVLDALRTQDLSDAAASSLLASDIVDVEEAAPAEVGQDLVVGCKKLTFAQRRSDPAFDLLLVSSMLGMLAQDLLPAFHVSWCGGCLHVVWCRR